METIDKAQIMEKTLNIYLDRILTHISKFMLKYEKSANFTENILNLIYSHPIYKNRKTVEKFSSIIEKAGLNFKEKIIEVKEKCDMKQKRVDELEQINNFIDINYEQLLTDINKGEKNLFLPTQIEINENDENNYDNLEERRNDIKKIRENKKFLKKKRKMEKNQKKEIEEKFKYLVHVIYVKKNFPQKIYINFMVIYVQNVEIIIILIEH